MSEKEVLKERQIQEDDSEMIYINVNDSEEEGEEEIDHWRVKVYIS